MEPHNGPSAAPHPGWERAPTPLASELRLREAMRKTILTMAVLASFACGGGASELRAQEAPGTDAQRGDPRTGRRGPPDGRMACPMMLPGAEVEVEDTEDGVAMTFTTERTSEVEALRSHVREMAALREQHAATRPGRGRRALPPSTSRVVDVPNGARLELAARDADDVDALRQRASMHAERMRDRRGCPMMDAPA